MFKKHHFNADKYQNHIANQTHTLTNQSHSFIVYSLIACSWLVPKPDALSNGQTGRQDSHEHDGWHKKIKTVHAFQPSNFISRTSS